MGRPPRQSLTSMLIEAVTERIQSGQYKRGDQLPTEKDMIEEFGVSRTVVREAISNLKASGLVSTHQGKGAFVLDEGVRSFRISEDKLAVVEEVLEALEFRIAIESEAAALAARRRYAGQTRSDRGPPAMRWTRRSEGEETVDLDIAFHRAIAAGDGQPALRRAVQLSRRSAGAAGAGVRRTSTTRQDAAGLPAARSAANITRSSMRSPPATATRRGRRSGCISAAVATGSRRARAPVAEFDERRQQRRLSPQLGSERTHGGLRALLA